MPGLSGKDFASYFSGAVATPAGKAERTGFTMRIPAAIFCLIVGLSFWSVPGAVAQNPDSLLLGIREAYQQLNYDLAEERGMATLALYDRLTTPQLIEVHTTLALVNYAQNELDAARRQFENALALQPDLRLDPLLVSPKILEFFEQIKRESQEPPNQPQLPPVPAIRYIQLRDVQTAAALRSLILPGWGQVYKGQKIKGGVLIGLWGVAGAGFILTGMERDRAHDKLEESDVVDDRVEMQDSYDRWRRRQTNFLIGAAGVWLYSYLDALLDRRPLPAYQSAQGVHIAPGPGARTLTVRYRITF